MNSYPHKTRFPGLPVPSLQLVLEHRPRKLYVCMVAMDTIYIQVFSKSVALTKKVLKSVLHHARFFKKWNQIPFLTADPGLSQRHRL